MLDDTASRSPGERSSLKILALSALDHSVHSAVSGKECRCCADAYSSVRTEYSTEYEQQFGTCVDEVLLYAV